MFCLYNEITLIFEEGINMIKDGIINIYKPQDWTSHDVVGFLRRVTGQRRTGHTGTLDPMATGVLPVCFGSATRIMDYLDLDYKIYECSLKLGLITDTLDIWGETVEARPVPQFEEEKIKETVSSFKGHISQIPPKYSAIKVGGRKLYDYARAGEEVEIKPREVYIKDIEMTEYIPEEGIISFRCVCSKGTYIRSICRDIGDKLSCGAAMCSLERTASGRFTIDNAVDIEDLRNTTPEEVEKLLYPVDYPLVYFGKGVVNGAGAKWYINGGWLEPRRVRILKEPEYSSKNSEIEVKDIYRKMYNIYEKAEDKEIFLGTAKFDEKENMFISDKVFLR